MPIVNSEHNRVGAICLIVAASAALLLSLPIPALATGGGDPLTADQEVPEMMMELQGSVFGYLAYEFGESGSPVNFSSIHDVSAKTFSFTSDVGSTYGGQPVVLSGSGVYNTLLTRWDFLVNGTVMGQPLSYTGTAVDPPFIWNLDFDPPPNIHIDHGVSFNLDFDTVVSAGYTEIRDRTTNQLLSSYVYADYYHFVPPFQSWFWSTDIFPTPFGNKKVNSSGFAPNAGGVGNFTASVVPEPASFGLFAAVGGGAVGGGALLRRGARRR
jgi:hypothetical protein